MAITTLSASEIQIISVKFSKDSPQIHFENVPLRIVYGGREYILADV